MKKYIIIGLTGLFFSCGSTNPKSSAVMTLKNGTTLTGLITRTVSIMLVQLLKNYQ